MGTFRGNERVLIRSLIMPVTGWLRGTVKAVPSGDTVLIVANAGPTSSGPPPEKIVTLAGIIAPRMGRRDGSYADEPFAFQSREALRRALIGEPVTFKVESEYASREFALVFKDGAGDIALEHCKNGWCVGKPSREDENDENAKKRNQLIKEAEEDAKQFFRGKHTCDPLLLNKAVRNKSDYKDVAESEFQRLVHGGEFHAIVDARMKKFDFDHAWSSAVDARPELTLTLWSVEDDKDEESSNAKKDSKLEIRFKIAPC